MADWSNLPIDLWSFIGGKLDVGADRIRFRSVSNSLRSSLPFPRPPWLVLSESDQIGLEPNEYFTEEEEADDDDDVDADKGMVMEEEVNRNTIPTIIPHRGIVDIGKQKIFEFNLPEAFRKRFIGSTGAWLITADTNKDVHLLNPFSNLQLELPSMSTFTFMDRTSPKFYRDSYISKAILSAPPPSGDSVAMVVYAGNQLAVARPGDTSWVDVQIPHPNPHDMIVYNGSFYLVNYLGVVMVCDIGDNLHSPTVSVLMDRSQFKLLGIRLTPDERCYLVEWMDELLLVIRYFDFTEVHNMLEAEEEGKTYKKSEDKPWYITNEFKVYKLNTTKGKWEELKSLGNYSLFLGTNTSVSLLASDYVGRVKKNCIYFTNDCEGYNVLDFTGGHDMGIFDMENNLIQPHYQGISTSRFSPPIWLIPNLLTKKSVTKLHTKKLDTTAHLQYLSFGSNNTYCAQHGSNH